MDSANVTGCQSFFAAFFQSLETVFGDPFSFQASHRPSSAAVSPEGVDQTKI